MRSFLAHFGLFCALLGAKPPQPVERTTPLEQAVRDAVSHESEVTASPGSLYALNGRFADLARDMRASQLDDIVTIVVSDKASAISKGATNSSRKSSAKAAVDSLGGLTKSLGAWGNLASLSGEGKLQGQGETSRATELTTTLSARVVKVFPNGNLLLEGSKDVTINSEQQKVTVRGLARWNDIGPSNRISSDRLAMVEVKVNGRGVVGDAVRRPNIIYRLLLGILPF
jgi:flagellar L-ring protein precursor FlgH